MERAIKKDLCARFEDERIAQVKKTTNWNISVGDEVRKLLQADAAAAQDNRSRGADPRGPGGNDRGGRAGASSAAGALTGALVDFEDYMLHARKGGTASSMRTDEERQNRDEDIRAAAVQDVSTITNYFLTSSVFHPGPAQDCRAQPQAMLGRASQLHADQRRRHLGAAEEHPCPRGRPPGGRVLPLGHGEALPIERVLRLDLRRRLQRQRAWQRSRRQGPARPKEAVNELRPLNIIVRRTDHPLAGAAKAPEQVPQISKLQVFMLYLPRIIIQISNNVFFNIINKFA